MLKVIRYLRTWGFAHAYRRLLYKLMTKSGIVFDVQAVKLDISRDLDRRFNSEVRYGPLKGYRFSPKSWWSMPDRASMLLGLYEHEILQVLAAEAKVGKRDVFIDIGAADGYYGVGCISQGLFLKSYCFEISEVGRDVILANAELNGVSKQVTILRAADENALAQIPYEDISRAVVLIDIEGFEFEFMDESVLETLSEALIIIEIHEWILRDDTKRFVNFRTRIQSRFNLTEIRTGARDLSAIPEVEKIKDHQRWLICSESRRELGKWWVLRPKSISH